MNEKWKWVEEENESKYIVIILGQSWTNLLFQGIINNQIKLLLIIGKRCMIKQTNGK
jgi:hypothetical protein